MPWSPVSPGVPCHGQEQSERRRAHITGPNKCDADPELRLITGSKSRRLQALTGKEWRRQEQSERRREHISELNKRAA